MKQHSINEKGETNFAFTDDRGTDSLDKDSLKQLKDTGDYQVKRSQPMNTKNVSCQFW